MNLPTAEVPALRAARAVVKARYPGFEDTRHFQLTGEQLRLLLAKAIQLGLDGLPTTIKD